MTIYLITKENCQVTKLTKKFFSKDRTKEALYDQINAEDRDPVELFRFESLEEARDKFEELRKEHDTDHDVTIHEYNNFSTAVVDVYELYEWEVDDDDPSEIISGGDIWDYFIV